MRVGVDTGASRRVVVAMSGGVDSSVAAAIVAEQGFEALGITMHLSGAGSRCCSLTDAEDARRVATGLGIRFFVANYKERFQSEVIEPFADAYLRGETPIPCVTCNSRFKFEYLLERAKLFGADQIATGHYARVDRDADTGRYCLRRAVDTRKDQTYYLFELGQAQLARIRFPLGGMVKSEVRARATQLGLATASKPESQEICFVPDDDYAAVVERIRPEAAALDGEIVDESGRVLGHHRGVHHFTVGQRRGLGLTSPEPLYVRRIEASARRIVVSPLPGLDAKIVEVGRVNWISGERPTGSMQAEIKIRSGHEPARGRLEPDGQGRVRVHFEQAVRAAAPGQAAVFYDGEQVLGGGWIAGAVQ